MCINGTFPDYCKIAKIIPEYKTSFEYEFVVFSMLSSFNKIFRKLLRAGLSFFLQ